MRKPREGVDFTGKIGYMLQVSLKRSFQKTFAFSLCFGMLLVSLLNRANFAVDIVPASAEDILVSLGPDAKGLRLSQESLPDLFALTASRIEENPKHFVVQQPYLEGRWKGGKAVIEYARDLSYTLVSIYDKEGNRQRIYSVRTNFTEHIARQADASAGRSVKAESPAARPAQEDSSAGRAVQAEPEAQSPPETEAPPRAAPKETAAASRTTTPRAAAGEPAAAQGGYEWDESKGTYVSVSGSAASPAEEPAAPAPAKTTVSETESAPAPKSRRRRRSAKTTTPPAAEVKVANTVWVEKTSEKPVEETPKPKRRRRHSETPASSAPPVPVVASSKMTEKPSSAAEARGNEEWVPKSIQETPPPSKERVAQRAVEGNVPSTEELLAGEEPPASREAPPPAAARAEKPSRRRRSHPASPPEEAVSAPEPAPPPARAPAPPPAQKTAPSTEESLDSAPNKRGPDTAEGDRWVPKAVPKPAPAPEPAVPKEEPTQVAMIPKPAPVDNSVENLLKMANEGKGGAPRESDAWVPKKTVAMKPEVDLNKEIERIRAQEKKQALPKPAVKTRRDVNNPEEGVLPVSTFEKFSGPLYGRHREYERRFFAGKKSRSGAPEHDFYVEEVDRKKEIHNVYFYRHQKGKAPKLVAVERHDRVSFMGNYDIDKEDKGKISNYN